MRVLERSECLYKDREVGEVCEGMPCRIRRMLWAVEVTSMDLSKIKQSYRYTQGAIITDGPKEQQMNSEYYGVDDALFTFKSKDRFRHLSSCHCRS
jgi:hypothetical protein